MGLKPQAIRTAFAWGVLLAFMALSTPDNLPVVVFIVPFVLMYLAFYNLSRLFGILRARLFAKDGEWKPHRRLGMAVSGSLVLLIVLQSLGQLTIRDVVTVIAIILLGYMYLARSRFVLPKH